MALGRPPGPGGGGPGRGGGGGGQVVQPRTLSAKGFQRLNVTDTRLTIDDDELAWQENALIVGKGISSVPLYQGDPGPALSPGLIKESFGCKFTYGGNDIPHPVEIRVFEDGSAWMRDRYLDGMIDRQIASAGTFSSTPLGTAITIWRDGPILFQDEEFGYASYDGSTLTLIDGGKKGRALAVFEGHVWLKTAARTTTYSAPNSYNDFTAGNGAGSFEITDDAFEGEIEAYHSTVEQLWIFAVNSIDALGNVATNSGLTTFAVTNAVASLGTRYRNSVGGYFRALVFATGYSIHGLLGVTPQKLSGKLDRLIHHLKPAIASGPRVGLQQIQGKVVLVFLFEFFDARTATTRSIVLGFDEGRAFLVATPDLDGERILDLCTLVIDTSPEVYGIDTAGRSYRIFARPSDAGQGTLTVSTKLYDVGSMVQGGQTLRVGVDLSADAPNGGTATMIPLTVTLVSEQRTVGLGSTFIRMHPVHDSPLEHRFALHRTNADLLGQRLGVTVAMPAKYYGTIEAIHLELGPTGEWEATQPPIKRVLFFNATTQRAKFINHAGEHVYWVN